MGPIIKGIVAVIIFSAIGYAGWERYEAFLTQGADAPGFVEKLERLEKEGPKDFIFKDISGKEHNLYQYKGKVVLVNFWATWCDPCVEEIPSLKKLVETFKGEVVLLAISEDESLTEVQKFLRTFKVDSPWFITTMDDDYKWASEWGTQVLPETYILNRDLKLVRKVAGIDDWSSPDAFKFFRTLLSE